MDNRKSVISRKKQRQSLENITPPVSPYERPHVREIMNNVVKLLEKNNCDDIVGMEVEDVLHPYYSPSPVIVETDESSKRKALYKYVRKTQKQEEKIRIRLMNIAAINEVEGLFISGLLIDYPLFKVVVKLFTSIKTLKVLRLVDCSLKKEAIIILGKHLGKTGITHLYLDRNPVSDQNYHYILLNNRVLHHLSLVQCHLDEKGARLLGRVLGPPSQDNPTHYLKSLNLNNNHLDCIATKFLSQGLKWNRDLLFLSMAGNRIGNAGMEYLSKAMQESRLEKWEKELKDKRLIKREEDVREMVDNLLFNALEEMEDDEQRDVINEGEDSDYENLLRRERMIQEYVKNDPNPLSCDVILTKDGKYITKGNRTLRGLNISYNKIDEIGFTHLLNTLRYQNEEKQTLAFEERMNYFLISINLMGNFCHEKCKVLKKIAYYLRKFARIEPENELEQEEEEENVPYENERIEEAEESQHEIEEEKEEVNIRESQMVTKHGKRRPLRTSEETKKDESMIDYENILTVVSDSPETDGIVSASEDLQKSSTEEEIMTEHSIVNESDTEE